MWTLIVFVVAGFTLLVLLRFMRTVEDMPTRFLFLAFWLRFVFSAFPDFVIRPIGPVSVNALLSIALTGTALALLDRRLFRLRRLGPIYAAIALALLSGVLNGGPMGTIEFVTRYLYLLGLTLLIYRGMSLYGPGRVLTGLLIGSSVPIILQFFSIPLGVVRATENDGSVSYVGGYGHEALFSIIVLGFIYQAALIEWRRPWVGLALVLYGVFSIILANYRTTVIAALPVLLVTAALLGARVTPIRARGALLVAATTIMLAAIVMAPSILPDRYADVLRVFTEAELITKDPDHFTRIDRTIFSGRVQLWLYYVQGWWAGDIHQLLVGHGPLSWERSFAIYAHNTWVSWLYEFGLIGVVVVSYMVFYNLRLATHLPDRRLAWILSACLGGFVLLNLATMPLWNIEGLNIFGFLLGYTWHAAGLRQNPAPTLSAARPLAVI